MRAGAGVRAGIGVRAGSGVRAGIGIGAGDDVRAGSGVRAGIGIGAGDDVGRAGRRGIRVRDWLALAVVGTLDAGANALYALATRHGLLSVVSVLSSLYPLATVGLARVLLGERVRRVQEIGVVAALTGVLLIAAG
jgi:drug/metabolite transporter (DMT)-like permease